MDRLMRDGLVYEAWTAAGAQRERWKACSDASTAIEPQARNHGTGRDEETQERLAWLVSTIEAEIIPRLMLAHRAPRHAPGARAARPVPGPAEIADFAHMVMGSDTVAARTHVETMRADGVALESVYLQLLAPTARYLGEQWSADVIDFTEVTTGLWRLQQVMYDLSPAFQSDADVTARPRRALLAPVPGSQHTFGLLMVAEFFQRAGWDVWTEPSMSLPTLLDSARSTWFDVVGLSVGSQCQLDTVASAILSIRGVSLNPQVGVMVGGPAFIGRPELVAQVGADATATDAPNAVVQAEGLVNEFQDHKLRQRC